MEKGRLCLGVQILSFENLFIKSVSMVFKEKKVVVVVIRQSLTRNLESVGHPTLYLMFPHLLSHLILTTAFRTVSIYGAVQFSLVTQSCLTLCDPMNCSTPGLPVT